MSNIRTAQDRNIFRYLASDAVSVAADPTTTARSYDEDERLYVRNNTISKANVCVYYGREIPGAEELGLLPNRPYRLLRDPEELSKAAPTFNNLPLLTEHPVPHLSASNPRPDLVIGSSGTDANFDGEFLRVSLVVWDGQYIKEIHDNVRREISSCYRYVALMQPGVFNGEAYDGKMVQIRGNHIALVPVGRAGPTVMVGDSKQRKFSGVLDFKEPEMKKRIYMSAFGMLAEKHLQGFLAPRLAADQKVDLAPVVKAMGSAKTFPSNIEKVAAALRSAIKDKLAADADVSDVQEVLAQIADMAPQVADLVIGGPEAVMAGAAANDPDSVMPGDPTDPTDVNAAGGPPQAPAGVDPGNATAAKPGALSNDPPSNVKKDGSGSADVSAETENKTGTSDTSAAPSAPESPEQNDNPNDPPVSAVKQFLAYIKDNQLNDEELAAVKAALEGKMAGSTENTVTKTAMDSAVSAATDKARRDTLATMREIRIAEQKVYSLVGALSPTLALDSAGDVYKHALIKLGHKVEGIHPSAYPTLLDMAATNRTDTFNLPKIQPIAAADSAGYDTRYGEASKRLK